MWLAICKCFEDTQVMRLEANKYLTLKDPSISEICIEVKIELNFYFHTSLLCLKTFYKGL